MKAKGSMGSRPWIPKMELDCNEENVKNSMNPCDMYIQVCWNLDPRVYGFKDLMVLTLK